MLECASVTEPKKKRKRGKEEFPDVSTAGKGKPKESISACLGAGGKQGIFSIDFGV